MKLFEIRLYNVRVLENGQEIYAGPAENLPEELKNRDSKDIKLENGEAVINI